MIRRLLPGAYEGWIVVGAAAFLTLIVASSFYYGFGTIFNEVLDEFGWSVAATSLAFSLRSEVGGLAAPFVGNLIDRLGARRVIVGGVMVAALGVLLTSMIQNLWQFYLALVMIAIGTSAAGGQAGLAAIASWFDRRRSAAMSYMTVGGGLGGVFVIFMAWLVEVLGWRDALRVIALVMLTVGIVLGLNVRSRPDDHPQPMDGIPYPEDRGADPRPMRRWGIPWRRAVRTRAFLLFSLGMLALSFGTNAVVVHQIPYLEREIGVSKAVAGASVALFTLSSIIGRLGLGILADRYSKQWMMTISAVLVVVGLPLLAIANSLPVAIVAILLIGPGFGGSVPIRPAMLADFFGTRYFGTVNGIGALMSTTGGAVGPWVVGFVVDLTGEYNAGWYVAAVVTALAIPCFLLAHAPTRLAEQYRAAEG